jgi:hypothetical protein
MSYWQLSQAIHIETTEFKLLQAETIPIVFFSCDSCRKKREFRYNSSSINIDNKLSVLLVCFLII